ncbi:hypothetical protein JZO66_04025 [Enterococcus sp. DIV0242_7C1]|uniref:Uncharacterized protein n=1 Tax=Candidatus Enterococcus dunnyi TaxID=1834192 RepID=A0AAQ3W575_9ENTE|nr:hypothetical protein [Enterococcus sp. DIV0242_7C1]MBO0469702.1 hypothetical protein [Enterococcus sp. DIV0242_7C1]
MKNTINRISIIIVSILTIMVVVYLISNINSVYHSLYFPNQEKEFQVKIDKKNIEPQISVYLTKDKKETFEIRVNDSEGKSVEPDFVGEDRFTPKNKFFYSYRIYTGKGKQYTVKIKNRTDSFVYSYVSVNDNN